MALALLGSVGLAMSGCASLPTSGPTAGDIKSSLKHAVDPNAIHVVEIDAAVASRSMAAATAPGFATIARTTSVDQVGPGDVLQIEVFEIGAGLFTGGHTLLGADATAAAAMPSATGSPLSAQGVMVADDGTVRIPYVGRVRVAGLTPDQIEQKIASALAGKSQSPQVLVTVAQNVANAVYMMGAVSRPGRFPLTAAHERLLDAISVAGGESLVTTSGSSTATGSGPQDYVVQITRDGRTVEERLESIEPGSADDIALAPGDRINLIRQPRTFIVLGAAEKIAQMPFESRALSLAEALARIGGPKDSQADPRYIYVFRDVPALRPQVAPGVLGADAPADAAKPVPTIYRLNMMTAEGLFLASRFAMQDKDVLYVSNSGANQPQKLAQIIGLMFSPFFAVNAAVR